MMFRFKRLSGDHLPTDITCFDIAKFAAVVLMVVDHMGMYVFPDQEWMRYLVPSSAPIWFFMLGYSARTDIPLAWWVGGGALIAMGIVVGLPVFPVNILFTMMILRVGIPLLMNHALKGRVNFIEVMAVLFLVAVPTMLLFEYGTQAFILAIFGYLIKNRSDVQASALLKGRDWGRFVNGFILFAALSFSLQQVFVFGSSVPEFLVIVLQTTLVLGALSFVRPVSFSKLTQRLSPIGSKFVQLGGRYTLEIYVLHLLMLQAYGLYSGLEGLEFMNWRWMNEW